MSSQQEGPKKSFLEGLRDMIITGGFLFWLIGMGGFAKLDEFLQQFGLHLKPFSAYDCGSLSKTIQGMKLTNVFGAQWEILLVKSYVQVAKTKNELRCRGLAVTSRGDLKVKFKVTDEGDGQLVYLVEDNR